MLKDCWHFLILGLVQGLTEFLPISSTAHLKVVPLLFGWDDPGFSISASLQLGSIISVLCFFRKDLFNIFANSKKAFISNNWQHPSARLGIILIVGTIPIVFCGLLIKLFWPGYGDSFLRSLFSIGLTSILMAFLLWCSERSRHRKKSIEQITIVDGVLVGLGQSLALIPGASRSGSAITAALFCGIERASAARFSFLLGIPAITLSGLVEIKEALGASFYSGMIPLIIGMCSAAISSWIAIDFLLRFLERNSTKAFILYRLFFGTALVSWYFL